MREILFRAHRVDKDQWAYGCYAFQGESHKILLKRPPGWGYHIDPETVGQYTGLTDKHGTKIFEGDIIQNVTEGKTAVVQWFSEHSAFMLWCKSENQVYWLYDNDFLNTEVIGNIYDNPELLGGTDNGCKKV